MLNNPKRRGEWVELQFMARAAHHGLTVSKPWGDSARYDFIVEYRGRFLRVQVKSSSNCLRGHYQCVCYGNGHRLYTADEIDFIALFVIPEEAWYILPFSAIEKVKASIWVAPRKKNKYQRYLEAWHLLRKRSPDVLPKRSRGIRSNPRHRRQQLRDPSRAKARSG